MNGLKPCPFCGATPHCGKSKPYHDQLHGELLHHYRIWCPHGCAEKRATSEALAADDWNARVQSPEIAQVREKAIEECAALMQRWSDDADEFSYSERCRIQRNLCRNAAIAIRNLAKVQK